MLSPFKLPSALPSLLLLLGSIANAPSLASATQEAQPTATITIPANAPTLNLHHPVAANLSTETIPEKQDLGINFESGFHSDVIGHRRAFCPGPPAKGCSNGMYNSETCQCDCIPPFCRDAMGECNQPLNNCGGNPWQDCELGVNCPWWVSTIASETCITGNSVPAGIWEIYPSRSDCCVQSYPYSKVCDADEGTSAPTKYPTIAPPPKEEFEIVPIKFSVMGLPDDVRMRDLKNQMTIVLKRILTDLQDVFPDLKISKVEERVVIERQRRLAVDERILAKDVDVYFDVYVVNVNQKRWGPIIIAELQDSYGDIMDKIATFQGVEYFNEGVDMNWCTTMNGKYSQCVREEAEVSTYTNTVNTMNAPRSEEEEGGFPVWAIVLIVILVLLILCAIAYCIYISAKDDDVEVKAVNNIYMNDEPRRSNRHRDGRSVRTDRSGRTHKTNRTRKSRAPGQKDGGFQLVLAHGEDPSFRDDDFTINTYKNRPDPSMYPGQLGHDAHDPNRPDPPDLGNVLMLTNGEDDVSGRKYLEDPPLKPKRDPSMYVDGLGGDDPSMMYVNNGEDPSIAYGRDEPSMYSSRSRDRHSHYGGNDDPSMQFDQYSAAQPDGDVHRMRSMYMGREDEGSQPDGDVQRYASMYMGEIDEESIPESSHYGNSRRGGGRDQYDDTGTQMSFRTQEPDESPMQNNGQSYYSGGRSRTKKSGKAKKTSKSNKTRGKKTGGESMVSSWGNVVGEMGDDYENQRKAKSFYG